MILLNVKLDNILCFNDFETNFTHPKKVVNSIIGEENLVGYPNFRYNKINIITGTNASGKSCFGRVINNAIKSLYPNFSMEYIETMISTRQKDAYLEFDFIDENKKFARIVYKYDCKDDMLSYGIRLEELKKNDSYESVCKRIGNINYCSLLEFVDNIKSLKLSGIFFDPDKKYTEHRTLLDKGVFDDYILALNAIMNTLDSSISEVKKSSDLQDAVLIKFNDGRSGLSIENNRRLDSIQMISTGTKYGFNIAYSYVCLKKNIVDFAYIDEQCSNLNSYLERNLLSILVASTKQGQQLFYTTHNIDMLSLNVPNHSYSFFIKRDNKIFLENAIKFEKRNNVIIKNLYENDVFGADPDISELNKLMED